MIIKNFLLKRIQVLTYPLRVTGNVEDFRPYPGLGTFRSADTTIQNT